MIDPTDPAKDGVQRPEGVLEKDFAGGIQDDSVDSPIENIEFVDGHGGPLIAQRASEMQDLIAVGRS